MATLILKKALTGTGKEWYVKFDFDTHKFSEQYASERILIDGIYFDAIRHIFMAIFSNDGKNYLYLENKLIVLTQDISINYYCGERDEKSWIKLFKEDELIFELEYINPDQTPFKDYFLEFEDWDVINFAHHLAQYIQKVKDNPGIVLFEHANED